MKRRNFLTGIVAALFAPMLPKVPAPRDETWRWVVDTLAEDAAELSPGTFYLNPAIIERYGMDFLASLVSPNHNIVELKEIPMSGRHYRCDEIGRLT